MLHPVRIKIYQCFMLIFTLLVCGAVHSEVNKKTFMILGDSLSAGYGLEIEQAWASRIQQNWQQTQPNWQLINASISGETTQGGLNRLPKLLKTHKPDHVLIELGGNDGLRGFQLPVIKQNLRKIVQLIKDSGATPILAEIQIPPNYGERYLKGFIQNYHEVAEIENIELLPFFLQTIAIHPELMQKDGIHPNADAQTEIAQLMQPKFEKLMKN